MLNIYVFENSYFEKYYQIYIKSSGGCRYLEEKLCPVRSSCDNKLRQEQGGETARQGPDPHLRVPGV